MGNRYSTIKSSNYHNNCEIPDAADRHHFAVVTCRDTKGGSGGGGTSGDQAEVSGRHMQYTLGTKSCAFELSEKRIKNRFENALLIFNDSACNFVHCGVKIERARGGGLLGGVESIHYTGKTTNPCFSSTRTSKGCIIETYIFSYGCSFREGLLVMEKKKKVMDHNEGYYKVTLAHYYVTKDVGISSVVKIRADKGEDFEIEVERPMEHPSWDLRMVLVETCRNRAWVPTACSHCVRIQCKGPGTSKQFTEFVNNRLIVIAWKIITGNQYLTGLINNTGTTQGTGNGTININRAM